MHAANALRTTPFDLDKIGISVNTAALSAGKLIQQKAHLCTLGLTDSPHDLEKNISYISDLHALIAKCTNLIKDLSQATNEDATQQLYRARLGCANLGSAKQSQMEAQRPNEEDHSRIGKADEEDPFGEVAASPNSHNLSGRGIVSEVFKKQLKATLFALEGPKTDTLFLFDKIFEIYIGKFCQQAKICIDRLDHLRKNRMSANHEISKETSSAFKDLTPLQMTISSLCSKCNLDFSPAQKTDVDRITKVWSRLQQQIDPHASAKETRFFLYLDSLLGSPSRDRPSTSQYQKTLAQHFSQLDEAVQKEIDCAISTEGKAQRFEDLWKLKEIALGIISAAMNTKIAEKCKKIDASCGIEDQEKLESFYTALHKVAFGPDVEAASYWAQEELPYLVGLIDDAFGEMNSNRKNTPLANDLLL